MATVIRSIAFNNFYNYYGDYSINQYNFKEGLNIVNADNGMGKSKLFNGILWILKDEVYDSDRRITTSIKNTPLKVLSDKAKLENTATKSGVKIIFDEGKFRYTVEKSFSFTKKRGDASTSNPEDWKIGEMRIDVSKTELISNKTSIVYEIDEQKDIIQNKLISPAMQSYALLQGEAIDDIVDLSNSSKLSATVEALTDISDLKVIVKSSNSFAKSAQYDLQKKQQSCTNNQGQFDEASKNKADCEKKMEQVKESIEIYKNELQLAINKAKQLEAQVSNTGKRIEYQEKCRSLTRQISDATEAYQKKLAGINDNIFRKGQPWLLLRTNGYVAKFAELRDEYNKERMKKHLLNNPEEILGATMLPEGSPDDISLEKMLKIHKCLVCNRDFEDDSEARRHIEYLRNRSKQSPESKDNDMHGFFDRIQNSIAKYAEDDGIFGAIAEERNAIKQIVQKISTLKKQLEDAKNEFFNYGGTKETLFESSDTDILNSYNKALEDKRNNEGYIKSAQSKLDELKNNIEKYKSDMARLGGSEVPYSYNEMRDVTLDIQTIFENTKKRIYDELIAKLEEKANYFYGKLTAGNNVLGGQLKFNKTELETIEIKVLNDNGDELSGASEGFQRMKKIAVVMAIISSNVGDEHFNYPFIADAPFSAFGKNFINNFFDAVPSVFNQSIIMIKDLYDVEDPKFITEDGHKILERMKSGELNGTFYVNYVAKEADTTGLSTQIKCYKY